MINITGVVTGEKAVVARLQSIAPKVRESVTRAMLRIVIDLQSYVVSRKLSGQLLKRRTGTLAASIQHKVISTSDGVTGVVGSRVNASAPLKYARPLEDGFEGPVTVRQHMRTIKQAWGRSIEPRTITVGAHTAHRNIKARRYLASSLEENRDRYVEQLDRAAGEGARS